MEVAIISCAICFIAGCAVWQMRSEWLKAKEEELEDLVHKKLTEEQRQTVNLIELTKNEIRAKLKNGK